MITVIFEVWPKDGKAAEYFDVAASLRPALEKLDGFISIERFESVTQPGKFVSISFWRDEAAVAAWRNVEGHRMAQAKGRNSIFADYRIRVASVMRDYSMTSRDEAPGDSREAHD
ncbi:MAG TPA: antibiotic biosynthesis monooxygenase [Burkholderiales bacterium]|nr:antibiotic biosynthesis monooxygenase [Burkholderiales bacterium]